MTPDKLYTEIAPPFCLEEGQRYQIKFTFDQFDPAKTDPKANFKWGVRHRAGAQYGRWEIEDDHKQRRLFESAEN